MLLLWLLRPFEVTVTQTGVAGFLVVVLSVASSYLTSRAAGRAAIRATEISSRTDIEKEAFERAKGFYTDVIERQAKQIDDLEHDLDTEKQERARETNELRVELDRVKGELGTAKRAIRRLRASQTAGDED